MVRRRRAGRLRGNPPVRPDRKPSKRRKGARRIRRTKAYEQPPGHPNPKHGSVKGRHPATQKLRAAIQDGTPKYRYRTLRHGNGTWKEGAPRKTQDKIPKQDQTRTGTRKYDIRQQRTPAHAPGFRKAPLQRRTEDLPWSYSTSEITFSRPRASASSSLSRMTKGGIR